MTFAKDYNDEITRLLNENAGLKAALRDVKATVGNALPSMTNVEMRTSLVTILRHILLEYDDMDLSKEADLENVIDALMNPIGMWARDVVDDAFRRAGHPSPFTE